jgi:hypothetical protein
MSARGHETRASTRATRTAPRTRRSLLTEAATTIMGSIDAFFDDDSQTHWTPELGHALAVQAIQAAGSRENLTAALELIKAGGLGDLASALGITVDGQDSAAKRASIDARYAELLASTVPSSAASAATSPDAGPPTGPGFVTPAPPSGHDALPAAHQLGGSRPGSSRMSASAASRRGLRGGHTRASSTRAAFASAGPPRPQRPPRNTVKVPLTSFPPFSSAPSSTRTRSRDRALDTARVDANYPPTKDEVLSAFLDHLPLDDRRTSVDAALQDLDVRHLPELKNLRELDLTSRGVGISAARMVLSGPPDSRLAEKVTAQAAGAPTAKGGTAPDQLPVGWATPPETRPGRSKNGTAGTQDAVPKQVPPPSGYPYGRFVAQGLVAHLQNKTSTQDLAMPSRWAKSAADKCAELTKVNEHIAVLQADTKDGRSARESFARTTGANFQRLHTHHGPEYLSPVGFRHLPGGYPTLARALMAPHDYTMGGFRVTGTSYGTRNWAELITLATTIDLLLTGAGPGSTPNWDAIEVLWRRMLAIKAFQLRMAEKAADKGAKTTGTGQPVQAAMWAEARLLESNLVAIDETATGHRMSTTEDDGKVIKRLLHRVAPQVAHRSY